MSAYTLKVGFSLGEDHEPATCTILVPASVGAEVGVYLTNHLADAVIKAASEVPADVCSALVKEKAAPSPEPRIKSEPAPSPAPDFFSRPLTLWLVNDVSVRLQVHVYASTTMNELRWAWASHQGQHGDLFGIKYQGNDVDLGATVEQVIMGILSCFESCANTCVAGSEGRRFLRG